VIGALNRQHSAYIRDFLAAVEAADNVTYLGAMDREALREHYLQAKLHVSLSWFEVVSQVDLEAIASGCPVVVSAWGHTRDYVTEPLNEFDPITAYGDLVRTRQLVERAYEEARPATIRSDYRLAWSDVARRLLCVYEKVVS
jgi:glycosyltransferase involved in cell wall biosynthesis